MNPPVSFGDWLQQRRKELDLTRQQLAWRVGCSISALRKLEIGERRPSAQLAELLANALELPPETRPTFLKVARGLLGVERLLLPTPNDRGAQSASGPARHASGLNLLVHATPLIGRQSELLELTRLLADPNCRLLTLTGPGGVGKTRLAISAAHLAAECFPDGAAFVPLASLTSASFFIPAIAEALGFSFSGPAEPQTQLGHYLRDKHLLLVLDNLEHLLADGVAEPLAELLGGAMRIKCLVTSREVLGLQAEWVLVVQGLPIPESFTATAEAGGSAVELFVQWARRADVGFTLKPADHPAVLRICQLVEGLPLALELAASWVRALSCAEIAAELEQSLDFLSASARDVPARHGSMRAVFDHSWKLLSEEEQHALSRLSVFPGGFTRQAAQAVASASLAALSSLVAKSLVRRAGAPDGQTYYDLHGLVRQCALAQLCIAGEVDALSRRFAQYYRHLAEGAAPRLTEADQVKTVALLQAENDNLRTALQWSLDSGDVEAAGRLCQALWRFWYTCGYFDEGLQWTARVLAAHPPLGPEARAEVLCAAAALAYRRGELAHAKTLAEESLTLQRESGDERGRPTALIYLGYAEQDLGRPRQARACLEESLALFRALNNAHGMTLAINGLANLLYDQGEHAAALRLFEEALELAQRRGDLDSMATALTNLGWSKALRGEPGGATDCVRALEIFHRLRNRLGVAFCLEGLAAAAGVTGQSLHAARLFGAAEAIREAISAPVTRTNRAYYEQLVALGRGQSNPASFAAAWAEGRAMTEEQAVSFALAQAALGPI